MGICGGGYQSMSDDALPSTTARHTYASQHSHSGPHSLATARAQWLPAVKKLTLVPTTRIYSLFRTESEHAMPTQPLCMQCKIFDEGLYGPCHILDLVREPGRGDVHEQHLDLAPLFLRTRQGAKVDKIAKEAPGIV
jgi:hypothetical protein